ncbi:mitochondrial inner membrane protein OXA1L, partial [Columba livia]|uniref:mitochondrial inner membrane protein OXA1L n=1 Tax=Columba livia TaxID=8932 RepID=UPI0031BB0920
MMAAVLRLRPLRAQALRGPPGPGGAERGLQALLIRGLASGGEQPIASVGLSPPSVGPTPPHVPLHTPHLWGRIRHLWGRTRHLWGRTPPLWVRSSWRRRSPPAPQVWGRVLLEDVGLGAHTPVGLIQNFLQFLHMDVGLPWWGAIATGTLCARLLLLPLVLRGQREAARLARHLPRLQQLGQRLQHARAHGDQLHVARAYSELVAYQKKHDVNPLRGFLVPLVQTPLFVSFFLALRAMAAAPLPGLRSGGWGWVPDLTAPDPLYVLPVVVTASTWMVLEAGAEVGVASPGAGPTRQLLRLLPLVFLPFILHFPTVRDPGVPQGTQEYPKGPRSSPRDPGVPQGTQEFGRDPGVPQGTQEFRRDPGVPQGTQEYPRGPRSSPRDPGSAPGDPGIPQGTQEFGRDPGVPQGTPECPRGPRNTPRDPGVL